MSPTTREPHLLDRGSLEREHPDRGDPAQGDRRRRAAAPATVVALVWVNSPAGGLLHRAPRLRRRPGALHLHLPLGTWSADGLLAIFFFVVGLELKREFVAGDLRDPARAAVPILAALGGVAVPAVVSSRSP